MDDFEQDYTERQQLLAKRRQQREALRRKHRRRQLAFYGGIVLILLLLILLVVRGCKNAGQEETVETPEETEITEAAETVEAPVVEEPVPEPEPTTATVCIRSVGDIMIYDDQLLAATQADGSYAFTGCFTPVMDYLSEADLTTANLETTFADGYEIAGHSPTFNAPVALAADLAATGFDLLSTANTYSMLYGISGLYSTIRHIQEAGMDNVGTFYTQEARNTDGGAVIREVNGVKVAFLAYTKNINDMYLPEGTEYAVNLLYEDYYADYTGIRKQMILDDIQAAKDAGAEIIIALPHWGSEYVFTTRVEQEQIADLMFENGVDAIVGCHSHVVGSMETREITTVDGEEKTVFIAYSLGNFLSSMDKDYTRETVILNLEFEKNLETGDITLSQACYLPCYLMDTGLDGTAYQIVSIHDELADYLAGDADSVSDAQFATLNQALEDLHQHAGEELDIENVQSAASAASTTAAANTPITLTPPAEAEGGTETAETSETEQTT